LLAREMINKMKAAEKQIEIDMSDVVQTKAQNA
jgi:hypothetical protein